MNIDLFKSSGADLYCVTYLVKLFRCEEATFLLATPALSCRDLVRLSSDGLCGVRVLKDVARNSDTKLGKT